MVKTKDYSVIINDQQNEYEFSAKKKNAIYLLGISDDDIDMFAIDGEYLVFSIKGKSFKVSDYKGIRYIKTYNTETYKSELFDIIWSCWVNNTNNEINLLSRPNYNPKKHTLNGTNYNDLINAQLGYEPTGRTNIKKNRGLTINGGHGDDEIIGTGYNDIINGGYGMDTITGGKGNDTITCKDGGTIYYSDGDGYDVINLTKNEYLEINADVPNYRYRLVGKNLVILFDNDENSGSITLKNYTKNILDTLIFNHNTYESLSELTENNTFYYDNTCISKKGVLTASAYNDEIKVENTTKKKYTINAGNGVNDITVTGGKNVIKSGKDGDTINISGVGNYTINAGAGINTINIDNSDNFGIVTINEQKVNAENNINFFLSDSAKYQKKGNDLYIIDNDNKVILKNYYAKVKNKTNWIINGQNLATLLLEQIINNISSGKISGTEGDDNITVSGTKDVSIYAGRGNDTIINNGDISKEIDGGAGNDNITNNGAAAFIVGGSGNDTICSGENSSVRYISFSKGDGNDILYLNAAENNLRFHYYENDFNYSWSGNDLIISHSNSTDSVTIKNYNPNNNNVIVNVGTNNSNYVNLATLVPEKPAVQSLSLGANMFSMNALNSQVAAFTSTNNSDIALTNDYTNDNVDLSTLVANYVQEQI